MLLDRKVAIVTGGNTGIGKSIVLALAKEGANIVIDYIANEQATEDLEKQIVALGRQGDRRRRRREQGGRTCRRLIDAAVKEFGRLDIMVNNAGVETRTSILDTTEAQYEKVLEINLKSAFFGTQLAAKQMIAQGDGGRIINITSVHEDWPMPGNTPYCLSKGGDADADPHRRRRARTARHPGGRRRSRGGRNADQQVDDGRSGQDEDPRHGHSRSGAWPSPKRSAASWRSSPATGASYLTATTIFADGGIMHSSPGSLDDGRHQSSASISRHRRWRLRRGRLREAPRQAGREGDARRPAQLHPVPAAAVPGRDRAGDHGRRGPARCAACSESTSRST